MSQSLSKVIVHAVFSTKGRHPFLKATAIRQELHRYLSGILNELDCQIIAVGGVDDHIHFLCALSRTCTQAEMIKEVKRGSAIWLKTKDVTLSEFAWQNGYGIFSIGFSQIEKARAYILDQEEHHRAISFQDEFRQMLQRYKVPFDERYVWD